MTETKNLCAKISIELHDQISSEKENSGLGCFVMLLWVLIPVQLFIR